MSVRVLSERRWPAQAIGRGEHHRGPACKGAGGCREVAAGRAPLRVVTGELSQGLKGHEEEVKQRQTDSSLCPTNTSRVAQIRSRRAG